MGDWEIKVEQVCRILDQFSFYAKLIMSKCIIYMITLIMFPNSDINLC